MCLRTTYRRVSNQPATVLNEKLLTHYKTARQRLERKKAGVAPVDDMAYLDSLIQSEAAKYNVTRLHTEKVAFYAERLALLAGRTPAECAGLRQAVRLHDIGKISMPDDILKGKNKTLTAEEMLQMQAHTVNGAQMLLHGNPGPIAIMAAEIALLHHEWGHGTGYFRLTGADLPWYVQITTIADAFEALTAFREYQTPLSPSQALAKMQDWQDKSDNRHYNAEAFARFKTIAPALFEDVKDWQVVEGVPAAAVKLQPAPV